MKKRKSKMTVESGYWDGNGYEVHVAYHKTVPEAITYLKMLVEAELLPSADVFVKIVELGEEWEQD